MATRGPAGERRARWRAAVGALAIAAATAGGCSTPLASARYNFELGRLEAAEAALAAEQVQNKDRVLFLMERGAIRQARGDYTGSNADFLEAADLVEQLETYSVSKGAASLVVNDSVQDFRGAPYERTLLHTMASLNFMALGDWENAAVVARRIIYSLEPEARGEYPDCAFSRYVAGFGLELIGDDSNAALQYRTALALRPGAGFDESGGRAGRTELVVFVLLGRGPAGDEAYGEGWLAGAPPTVEIEIGGQVVGRAVALSDTVELAAETERKLLALKLTKTVSRIALKEVIATAVEKNTENEFLGALTRLVLIGLLERPDVRRWETLPRWLMVARVPAPADLSSFRVRVNWPGGGLLRAAEVAAPLQRRGGIFVSLYREIPPGRY